MSLRHLGPTEDGWFSVRTVAALKLGGYFGRGAVVEVHSRLDEFNMLFYVVRDGVAVTSLEKVICQSKDQESIYSSALT